MVEIVAANNAYCEYVINDMLKNLMLLTHTPSLPLVGLTKEFTCAVFANC